MRSARGVVPAPTLPTMETVDEERAAAAGEALAVSLADRLRSPLASVSRTTGDMETNSPLFSGSDANLQRILF